MWALDLGRSVAVDGSGALASSQAENSSRRASDVVVERQLHRATSRCPSEHSTVRATVARWLAAEPKTSSPTLARLA